MKHFHAHVYFEAADLEKARAWTAEAERTKLFRFVKLQPRPVGPHPTGMIETHFTEAGFAAAVKWLEENHGEFSVLVHNDTGNDYQDHTDGIRWLGKPMPLDFGFFDLIESRPDLKINK